MVLSGSSLVFLPMMPYCSYTQGYGMCMVSVWYVYGMCMASPCLKRGNKQAKASHRAYSKQPQRYNTVTVTVSTNFLGTASSLVLCVSVVGSLAERSLDHSRQQPVRVPPAEPRWAVYPPFHPPEHPFQAVFQFCPKCSLFGFHNSRLFVYSKSFTSSNIPFQARQLVLSVESTRFIEWVNSIDHLS